MSREISCPSCGFPIPVLSAATLVVGCPQCGVPAYRTGVNLEALGQAAELAELGTRLSIGARGKLDGSRVFTVIGVVQYDHGRGLWNEWHALFDDQTTAWIAEAQGEYHVSREADGAAVPDPAGLAPGRHVATGGRTYVVAERGRAVVAGVRGEAGLLVRPGDKFVYADLRGPGATFATIAQHGAKRSLFVGRTVAFDALGIDPSSVAVRSPRRVAGGRFACPTCGAAISMRDPDGACRVVCESCSSILRPDSERLVLLAKQRKLEEAPRIPLGSTAVIDGADVTVIAYLVRSVTVDGTRYPWSEYLLRAKDGSYRWLVDSRGHWSITSPVNGAEVTAVAWAQVADRLADRVSQKWRDMRHRHFQSGVAVVEHVQGEVYWEMKAGERVMTHDYIHRRPDGTVSMLSSEVSEGERVWSRVDYVEPERVAAWFGKVRTRTPRGVAPNQPNPHGLRERQLWKVFLLLAAALALAAFLVPRGEDRFFSTFPLTSGSTAVSEPFTLDRTENLGMTLSLDVADSWFGAEGMLHESATGLTVPFAAQANWWTGETKGEPPGGGTAVARLVGVSPGTWTARVTCEAKSLNGTARGPTAATMTVRTYRRPAQFPICILVVLLAVPIIGTLVSKGFENRRWEDSDHPPGGG